MRALSILLLLCLCALPPSASLAIELPTLTDEKDEAFEISADLVSAVDGETDPCIMEPDQEMLGLDWSRRQLHRGICATVRWFDAFFGEERFDDAAQKIRGRLAYTVEQRERVGRDTRPRLRLRVSTPNLNRRANLFIEREDERTTILTRTGEETVPEGAQPSSASQSEALRIGFGYDRIKRDDEALDFRLSLRLRQGELAPSARARYRREFLRTDVSQWRFTETLFWRRFEGWGETTAIDYERKIGEPYFFRWFNDGTWSQDTLGLAWRSGVSLYRDFGAGRAALAEARLEGQTDGDVGVSNYGPRFAYRQTLGRKWLLGEVYTGYDWPKTLESETRRSQFYAGITVEVLFGHYH